MVPLLGVVFGMQALDGFFAGCAHESGIVPVGVARVVVKLVMKASPVVTTVLN